MPRICKNFEITGLIYSNSERSTQFFNFFWRFLRTNTLEQLELELGKNNWDLEAYRKSWIRFFIFLLQGNRQRNKKMHLLLYEV